MPEDILLKNVIPSLPNHLLFHRETLVENSPRRICCVPRQAPGKFQSCDQIDLKEFSSSFLIHCRSSWTLLTALLVSDQIRGIGLSTFIHSVSWCVDSVMKKTKHIQNLLSLKKNFLETIFGSQLEILILSDQKGSQLHGVKSIF